MTAHSLARLLLKGPDLTVVMQVSHKLNGVELREAADCHQGTTSGAILADGTVVSKYDRNAKGAVIISGFRGTPWADYE